ncbi:MAG: hypothetical protein LBU32_20755 [Clostridiales bacterium]|nr:hypothetical protein [Clostridiales bacterium]
MIYPIEDEAQFEGEVAAPGDLYYRAAEFEDAFDVLNADEKCGIQAMVGGKAHRQSSVERLEIANEMLYGYCKG